MMAIEKSKIMNKIRKVSNIARAIYQIGKIKIKSHQSKSNSRRIEIGEEEIMDLIVILSNSNNRINFMMKMRIFMRLVMDIGNRHL